MEQKEIRSILNQEIKWCKDNPLEDVDKKFRKGFIEGLKQAKRLLVNKKYNGK